MSFHGIGSFKTGSKTLHALGCWKANHEIKHGLFP
jgi:hypothetical protein